MSTKAMIGSARIDENGNTFGGRAGDQSGKEVSTQRWYLHAKGWRVLRAVSRNRAEALAAAMESACENPHIGYDQHQRASLRTLAEHAVPAWFPGAVDADCETDCSELVRTCIAYAAGKDVIGSVLGNARFSTANQVKYMLKTGLFTELVGDAYTCTDRLLQRGDVLVTRTQGHTVIVLTDGCDAAANQVPALSMGCRGEDVRSLQEKLMQLGYSLPVWGADGEYGTETAEAVRAFQAANGFIPTGSCDSDTLAAIRSAAESGSAPLRFGDSGSAVLEMQKLLMLAGFPLPRYGADGEFGRETAAAIRAFRRANTLPEADAWTIADAEVLRNLLDAAVPVGKLLVTGSRVNVRSGAGTESPVSQVVRRNDALDTYGVSANGWRRVKDGWISGIYTEVMSA